MKNLETLVLADDNFTDAAMEFICQLPNLKLLNLNGSRVTDKGIAKLQTLTQLEEVMLGDTGVTADGV